MVKKSVVNVRRNVNHSLNNLRDSGKTIDHIAGEIGCSRSTVLSYYRSSKDPKRASDPLGFIRSLKLKGTHESVIEAIMGDYDTRAALESLSEPTAAKSPSKGTISDILFDNFPKQPSVLVNIYKKDEATSMTSISQVPVVATDSSGFLEGDLVTLKKESVEVREELFPLLGVVLVVADVVDDDVLVEFWEESGDVSGGSNELVTVRDLEHYVVRKKWVVDEEAIFTDGDGSKHLCTILPTSSGTHDNLVPIRIVESGKNRIAPYARLAEVIIDEEPSTQIVDQEFFFNEVGCKARGRATDSGGIIVLAGSTGKPVRTRGATPSLIRHRLTMLEEEYAVIRDGKLLMLKDFEFDSPSAATSALCGRTSNGRTGWKNKNGVSYGDL